MRASWLMYGWPRDLHARTFVFRIMANSLTVFCSRKVLTSCVAAIYGIRNMFRTNCILIVLRISLKIEISVKNWNFSQKCQLKMETSVKNFVSKKWKFQLKNKFWSKSQCHSENEVSVKNHNYCQKSKLHAVVSEISVTLQNLCRK